MKALLLVLCTNCASWSSMTYDSLPENLLLTGATRKDANHIQLWDGREIRVDLMTGMLVQRFAEDDLFENDNKGLCGVWIAREQRIVVARWVPECGDLDETLLHEVGHAYGMPDARRGVMAGRHYGPITEAEREEFRQALQEIDRHRLFLFPEEEGTMAEGYIGPVTQTQIQKLLTQIRSQR